MPKISRTYIVPVATGTILALLVNRTVIAMQPALLDAAPRDDLFGFASGWIVTLLSVAPGLVVGMISTKRPMLLGFCASLLADLIIHGYRTYISLHQISPITHLSVINMDGQSAVFGAIAAGAGFLIGSSISFKPKPLRSA